MTQIAAPPALRAPLPHIDKPAGQPATGQV
jgi:hypothetical protein